MCTLILSLHILILDIGKLYCIGCICGKTKGLQLETLTFVFFPQMQPGLLGISNIFSFYFRFPATTIFIYFHLNA